MLKAQVCKKKNCACGKDLEMKRKAMKEKPHRNATGIQKGRKPQETGREMSHKQKDTGFIEKISFVKQCINLVA